MRYGAFLQIFREIRKGMEGKGGKWEFSFRHGLHGFHRDFSFLLCLCHPVVEGSHVAHTQYNMRCLDKLDMTGIP